MTAVQADLFVSPKKKRYRFVKVFVVVIALLAILFVAAEYFLVPIVNRVLDKAVTDRFVQVTGVQLQPWFGQVGVEGLTVSPRKSKGRPAGKPELEVARVDVAIDVHALLDKTVVASMHIRQPTARFTASTKKKEVSGPDLTLAQQLGDLIPLRLNRLEVNGGKVFFTTQIELPSGTNRALNLKLTKIEVLAENLTNSAKISRSLTGTIKASASAETWGDIDVNGKLNAMAKQPTFDIDASLRNLQLTEFSDWTMAFGRFSFTSGSLDVFTEVAAKNGSFVGYVKPLAKDVKTQAIAKDLGAEIIAGVVEGVTKLLSNPTTKRAGSKVEFRGNFSAPQVDVVGAIIEVLKNAVIKALRPVVDGEIDLSTTAAAEK